MAARWMQAKMTKLKRDGMRDSRGPFERFSSNPSKHTPRATRAAGWYAAGNDKRGTFGTYRTAPRSIGPFATKEAAERAARGMFDGATVKVWQV